MPTKREREYYRMGFRDGMDHIKRSEEITGGLTFKYEDVIRDPKPRKRKLSAWNKFVKANSKKPRFRYARSNKINLKKMAVAFRKTPAGRKKRR